MHLNTMIGNALAAITHVWIRSIVMMANEIHSQPVDCVLTRMQGIQKDAPQIAKIYCEDCRPA